MSASAYGRILFYNFAGWKLPRQQQQLDTHDGAGPDRKAELPGAGVGVDTRTSLNGKAATGGRINAYEAVR